MVPLVFGSASRPDWYYSDPRPAHELVFGLFGVVLGLWLLIRWWWKSSYVSATLYVGRPFSMRAAG